MDIQEVFNVALEKMMNLDISTVFWSNIMDLLAILTKSNILEMHRISYKSQKIFQIEEKDTIISASFSPDSQNFVYTCQNGKITILLTETGEKIFELENKLHTQSIININWSLYSSDATIKNISPIKKNSLVDQIIMPLSSHIYSDKYNLIKLRYLTEDLQEFSLMATSDIEGNVVLSLNGIHSVSKFNVRDFINEKQIGNIDILFTFVSNEAANLNIVLALNNGTTIQNLCLMSLETSVLNHYKNEITIIGYIMGYIGELLNFLKNTINSIFTQIKELSKLFRSKLIILDELLKANNINLTPNQELLRFLKSGIYSIALSTFLGKEIYDTKILQKLDETLNITINNIQDFILESCQNVIIRITILLGTLINMAQIEDRYKVLGLDLKELENFESLLTHLSILTEELLLESSEAKINLRNLLVWLNKNVIKTTQENDIEIENHKSYLNKYTVDFDRLYILLNGDYLFHMRNLLSFFMEDELNQNQDKKQKKESFDKKPTPKQKFHSILFESTFKEIKNIRSSMNETMKNEEGTMKNDSTMFKRNIFSNLQETENKQNFSETFKKIENTWTQIISNPPNSISRSFCLKNFIKLGFFDVQSDLVVHSPQEMIKNEFKLAFFRKMSEQNLFQICNFYYDESLKLNMKSNFIELPKSYDLKEISIAKDQEIIVLLQEKHFMKSNEKAHCLLGSLNLSQIKKGFEIPLSEGQTLKDDMQYLNYIPLDVMNFKKVNKIEGINSGKLKSSLRGLISIINEENKLIIFDQS